MPCFFLLFHTFAQRFHQDRILSLELLASFVHFSLFCSKSFLQIFQSIRFIRILKAKRNLSQTSKLFFTTNVKLHPDSKKKDHMAYLV